MTDGSRRTVLRLMAAGAVTGPLLSGCSGTRHHKAADTPAQSPGAPLPPGAPPPSGAPTIMIIRHGEKPTGSQQGVTADGLPNPGSLTVRGWTRAGALVELFAPAASPTLREGLVRPDAVYAAKPDGDSGQRHSETVTPLAQRLGGQPDLSFGKGDEHALGRHLATLTGATVVAWEHSAIPKIVKALGAVTPAPPAAWADDRFDIVWTFTRTGSGWRFRQVPQLLLAGDRPDPIG